MNNVEGSSRGAQSNSNNKHLSNSHNAGGVRKPKGVSKSSPKSPRKPITETLNVDVDLANERFEHVSPGRRCLSDSRVTKNSKGSIPVSSSKKRKLDFLQKSVSLTPSKFYKLDSEVSLKLQSHISFTDINQNFRKDEMYLENDNKCNGFNVSSINHSPSGNNHTVSPSFYKTQHRIGSRRASNSYFSYSETTLSSPWKVSRTRVRNSSKISPVPPIENKSSQALDNMKHIPLTNGSQSPTEDPADDVFLIKTYDSPKSKKKFKKDPEKPIGKQKKQEKVKTAEKPEKKKKRKASEVIPDIIVPRKRRLASLDAQTKVQILCENRVGRKKSEEERKRNKTDREICKKSETGKPVISSNQISVRGKNPQEMKNQTSQSASSTKCTVVGSSAVGSCKGSIQGSCKSNAHGISTDSNKLPGKVTCLNCGSETPAIYVHSPPEISGSSISSKGFKTKPTSMNIMSAAGNKNPTSLPYAILELLKNDSAAVIQMLALLAQWRQKFADSVEKADSSLKSKLSRRLSKRSVDKDEASVFANLLINYLLSLLNPKATTCAVPDTFITSHPGRPRLIRKINKPPNLKPISEKLGRKKPTNGWRGVGKPVAKPIVFFNENERELRYCYDSIKRKEDVIRVRDCVLLRAGTRKKEIPFVAKVSAIFEDPDTGDIMFSLLWFYRPEHTETGRQPEHIEQELFACRHWDVNSVSCIEDKCYVLTMDEYCRFRAELKKEEQKVCPSIRYVPSLPTHLQAEKPTMDTAPENVFLCRQVYDYKQRRLLKNPVCKLT